MISQRAVQDCRDVELSKRELKDSLKSKFKIEEQRLQLAHQSEETKTILQHQKDELLISHLEDKIKSLLGKIDCLKHKAKQYDVIASSGMKSLISLNAFNERGLAQ